MAKNAKNRIVEIAFILFLKNGYQGVSLQDILDETGLSKGAIYHHFKNKEAIYLEALETYFFKLLELDLTEDADATFRERIALRMEHISNLVGTIENLGEGGIDYPIRCYFTFQLESEKNGIILAKLNQAMEAYRQQMIDVVQQAIDQHEIVDQFDASMVALQIISMLEGIAIHYSAEKRNLSSFLLNKYQQIIGAYLDMLCLD